MNDEKVITAIKWLKDHPDIERPEGISIDDPDQWHLVLVYYHIMVRSEVYHLINWQGDWQFDILTFLKNQQFDDGSFLNPDGARNKEDDPILATAMAILALRNALI